MPALKKKERRIEKYGLSFPEDFNDLMIELNCFLHNHPVERGGLGKVAHFKEAAQIMWGNRHEEFYGVAPKKIFIWHPWADEMLEQACKWGSLGVVGSGSSGKTDFFSIWAIINWLCYPTKTKVLVTSTSLKESRKRIWGSIREYYMAIPGLPGKLVDSLGQIRLDDADIKVSSDRCGIELIPGEKKKEKEAIGKLIGIKAKRIFFIADELPELSEALLTAYFSNMSLNTEKDSVSQIVGIGNFNSMYDPLGVLVKPKGGYNKLTPDTDGWETDTGYCLRLDGLKSPNILLGEDVWPIFGLKQLEKLKSRYGENTAEFWRMCRSYPCPAGEEHIIFTEADFNKGDVHGDVIWQGAKIPLSFLDPGFTTGGDKSVAHFGYLGIDKTGKMILSDEKVVEYKDNVTQTDVPRNIQIILQWKTDCERFGVEPQNAGYDMTGAGIVYGELISELWSPKVNGITFGGSASDMRVSDSDVRVGKEAYANKVTELWYGALPFVQSGHIKKLDDETAKELIARKYETTKSEGGLRTCVEPKAEMKKRIGKSPDKGDSWCGMVFIARHRHGFTASGVGSGRQIANKEQQKQITDSDNVYDVDYTEMVGEEEFYQEA